VISHDRARALISARYDQLLSAAETRDLHEHLATCAACRQFASNTDLLVNGLRTLPQLPPSPRVSRAVRDGIRGSTEAPSPSGWLGQALRIAASPTLAVASSLVLVAALAFIIVLALRPLGLDEQPRATISALADVIETPTTEPERTPVEAPTVAPTEPVVAAPTQEPTPAPTARLTNVTPPTQTPAPTTPAEPTPAPTQRSILAREQRTVAPVVETPAPTAAPPPVATQPPPAPVEEAPTSVIEAANQAVSAEPTAPPIMPTTDGAPFTGEEPPATEEDAAPVLEQPAIEPGGPDGGAVVDAPPTSEPNVADDVAIMAGPEPTAADDAGESQAAAPAVEPTAPTVAPTPTPVAIVAAESAPPAAADATDEMPQLPVRDGNEAIGMDGESMVAAIQATVQAGLADDSGPPPVPTSAPPPTSAAPVELTPSTGDPALAGPTGAEITGAPASDSLATGSEPITSESAPPVTDAAAVDPAAGAAVELAPTVPPVEQAPAPTQAIVAPAPGWPSIDGSVPIWSPDGTRMLVIGADGLGAVWDANAGAQIPVERPAAPARDVPVGWYGGEPLVQRVYLDGSGLVELRVVPISGTGGYVLGTATTDSVFGEGVIAASLSPDGSQISFISGGQLYIAPVSDPGSASPGG
jgi:hypothetical protein